MRLKISFEDVKLLFQYLDKDNSGSLNYEKFTLLLEERWRGIDPIEASKSNQTKIMNPMKVRTPEKLKMYEDCENEQDMILKRENLARSFGKLKRRSVYPEIKITHDKERYDYSDLTAKIQRYDNKMADIMKGDYQRRSLEQRITLKELHNEYKQTQQKLKYSHTRPLGYRAASQSCDSVTNHSTHSKQMDQSQFKLLKEHLKSLKKQYDSV